MTKMYFLWSLGESISIKWVCKSITFYMAICVLIISIFSFELPANPSGDAIVWTATFKADFAHIPQFLQNRYLILFFWRKKLPGPFCHPTITWRCLSIPPQSVVGGAFPQSCKPIMLAGPLHTYRLLFKKVKPQSSWVTICKGEKYFYTGNLLQEQSGC